MDIKATVPGVLKAEIKDIVTNNFRELAALEANLLGTAQKGHDVKTILVTSSNTREGKSVAAVSIAYALYKDTNLKVLLIDGNFHAPRLNELFNVDPAPGFADYILNNAENVFKETEFEGILLMPQGSTVANPLDVFRAKNFSDKLNALRNTFDYVICDGHSVMGASDTSMAARYFDGVVIVVECEKTKWEVMQMSVEKIRKLQGNVIGAVMNRRKYYVPRSLYGKI